jgi:hypothetical protein
MTWKGARAESKLRRSLVRQHPWLEKAFRARMKNV